MMEEIEELIKLDVQNLVGDRPQALHFVRAG